MIVRVDSNGVVTLEEAENFTQFSVSNSTESLDEALRSSAVGRVLGQDALISVEWLRTIGRERSLGLRWSTQLDEMLAFAATRGWLKDEGASIQAHIDEA